MIYGKFPPETAALQDEDTRTFRYHLQPYANKHTRETLVAPAEDARDQKMITEQQYIMVQSWVEEQGAETNG